MISPVELLIIIVALVALARAVQLGRGGAIALGVLCVSLFGWMRMRSGVGILTPPMHPANFDGGRIALFPILLLVAGVVALFASRRHGHAVRGLLAFGAIGGLLIFLLLGSAVTYRRMEMQTPVAPMDSHAAHMQVIAEPAEVPIDELWNQLNEPRIQMSAPAPGETTVSTTAVEESAMLESAKAIIGSAVEVAQALARASAQEHEVAQHLHAVESHEAEMAEAAAAQWAEAPSDPGAGPAAVEPTEPAAEEAHVEAAIAAAAVPAVADNAQATIDEHEHGDASQDEDWSDATSIASAEATSDKPKPEWVGAPPKNVENIYRVPVQAGPYVTLKECYEQLRQEMRDVVKQRVEELVREETGSPHIYVPDMDWLQIGAGYIDRELLTDEYVETIETDSVGTMRTAWGLLEFTPNHDRHLVESWKRYARRDGMAIVASIASLVLAVLGGILLLLKIDTWTRGYYTKRLFLGVPGAIIAFVMLIAAMS